MTTMLPIKIETNAEARREAQSAVLLKSFEIEAATKNLRQSARYCNREQARFDASLIRRLVDHVEQVLEIGFPDALEPVAKLDEQPGHRSQGGSTSNGKEVESS